MRINFHGNNVLYWAFMTPTRIRENVSMPKKLPSYFPFQSAQFEEPASLKTCFHAHVQTLSAFPLIYRRGVPSGDPLCASTAFH